jgi:hypothetical protein
LNSNNPGISIAIIMLFSYRKGITMSKIKEAVESLAALALRLRSLIDGEEIALDASLYEARIRCGRKGCRCMRTTHRHGMWCLSQVKDGKSRTRTVPQKALAEVRGMCQAHKRLREARRELLKLAMEAGRLIDRHGMAMAKKGWRRFEDIKKVDE